LAVHTRTGNLHLRRLRRGADLSGRQLAGPPPEQSIKLKIPAKTQLYLDQAERERQNGVSMHRAFQRDFYLSRLAAARTYAASLTRGLAPVVNSRAASLRLHAQVRGIGPSFTLELELQVLGFVRKSNRLVCSVFLCCSSLSNPRPQNTAREPLVGLTVSLTFDPTLYRVTPPGIAVRMLLPFVTHKYTCDVKVLCCCSLSLSLSLSLFFFFLPPPT
jgi:hypothetical protein